MKNVTEGLFREYCDIQSISYAPDGKKAAFVMKTTQKEEDDYDYTIWLLEDGVCRPISGLGKEGTFIWDDENTLLFPAVRKDSDKKKLEALEEFTVFYRLPLTGGEAQEAFRVPVRVERIEKIKDKTYMLIAKCDANVPDYYKMSDEERAKVHAERKENRDFAVLDESPFWMNGVEGFTSKLRSRLFVYEEDCNMLTPGSDPLFQVNSTAIIGDDIFACGVRYDRRVPLPHDVIRFNITTKETHMLYKNERFYCRFQMISSIGDQLVFMAATDEQYGQNTHPDFWKMDIQSGELTLLCEGDYSFYVVKAYQDCMVFHVYDRRGSNLYAMKKDGSIQQLTDWTNDISSFDYCKGKLLISAASNDSPSELYEQADEQAPLTRISHFHKEVLQDTYVGECELLTIPSHDYEIDGWVIKPKDFDPEKTYPAILTIHGGPKGVYYGNYSHEMQLWASQGYFVFFCNPLGSDGRGNAFAEIRRLHGTLDYEDIMHFTDAVLQKYPQIDAERMGVTGVSYGGYMTNWIIGHTNRFHAASSQCSVVNWVSMYGVSDISMGFVPDQMDGTIFDSIETYWEHSPLKYANQVTTPTLFIQPLSDYRCHLSDGLQMATALMDHNVETRVCTFAGDHHGLNHFGKPSHRERSFKETLHWMDAHLKER